MSASPKRPSDVGKNYPLAWRSLMTMTGVISTEWGGPEPDGSQLGSKEEVAEMASVYCHGFAMTGKRKTDLMQGNARPRDDFWQWKRKEYARVCQRTHGNDTGRTGWYRRQGDWLQEPSHWVSWAGAYLMEEGNSGRVYLSKRPGGWEGSSRYGVGGKRMPWRGRTEVLGSWGQRKRGTCDPWQEEQELPVEKKNFFNTFPCHYYCYIFSVVFNVKVFICDPHVVMWISQVFRVIIPLC